MIKQTLIDRLKDWLAWRAYAIFLRLKGWTWESWREEMYESHKYFLKLEDKDKK